MGNVKFGNISTKDLDLIVQAPPAYTFPERDVEIQHIPGRNGDVVIDKKCYKNVNRVYSIASVFRSGTDFIANSERLIEWLTSNPGYQRLEDSYDPDVYRMATYKEGGSLVNYWDQATALNITFECKPQRYLKVGEIPVEFTGNLLHIYNPTLMPALPMITISNLERDSDHVLMMNIENYRNEVESLITISTSNAYGSMTIDSEDQLVYNIIGTDVINLSEYVHFNGLDFPKLTMKDNTIRINKYSKESENVFKYSSLMDNYKQTIYALYKPFETLLDSKQDEASLRSYSQLVEDNTETYSAEAYSNYCIEHGITVQFRSINELIKNNSMTIPFNSSTFAKPVNKKKTFPTEYEYIESLGLSQQSIIYKTHEVGELYAELVLSGLLTFKYNLYMCVSRYQDDENHKDFAYWKDQGKWEIYDNRTDVSSPTIQMYYWEITPIQAAIPVSELDDSSDQEKYLILVGQEYETKENSEKVIKVKNQYMFLYRSQFTYINENHSGAFIMITDETDDNFNTKYIKYIEAIDPIIDISPSIAEQFYNNTYLHDHDILTIFPEIADIIGKGHECSITLYKAKWEDGIPQLDIIDEDNENQGYISQNIVYNTIKAPQEYKSTSMYNKNDKCMYDNAYYRCNSDKVTGTWNSSKWDQIDISVIYDGEQVLSVTYTNDVEGYFYKDNSKITGILSSFSPLFGMLLNSTGWSYVDEPGKILESADWDTRQRVFNYKSGISETSDYVIERIFIASDDLPLYEDIILEDVFVKDENGNPVIDKAGNKINEKIIARFHINSVDSSFKKILSIKVHSNDPDVVTDGYYKILDDAGNPVSGNDWIECFDGDIISVDSYNMKTTKSYNFLFIDKSPSYQNEKEFPEWLDIEPVLYSQNHVEAVSDLEKLNAKYYDFKVKETAWYRYIYINNNSQLKTQWALRNADSVIGDLTGDDPTTVALSNREVGDIVTFNKIEKLEDSDRFPVSKFNYVSHEPLGSVGDTIYSIIEDQDTWDDLVHKVTKTYTKNDICIYEGLLYVCIVDETEGSFVHSDWNMVATPIIVEEYDEATVYEDNSFCLYGRTVYKSTSQTTGPWDETAWDQVGNYVKDVGFYYLDERGNQIEYPGNIPDDWIIIKIAKGSKPDFTDTQLEFYFKDPGYYKWDTNVEWIKKEDPVDTSELMVAGNATSDTMIYYLNKLPKYSSIDPATGEPYLSNLYDADKIDESNSGNPEHVEIKVKEAGFYKVETNPNYKYYIADSLLAKISIYESPTLIHLEEVHDSSLNNLNVTITPRWWKL